MKITNPEQLNQVRDHCKKMVMTRAMTAGVASAIPGAVTGLAADVGILLELLPNINKAFGLDPEQIDALDEQVKQQMLVLAGSVGSQIIGRAVTNELVLTTMKAVGVRTTMKVASSWVPFIGSAIGGVLGFGMMRYVGNRHVDECYELISELLDNAALDVVKA